MRLLTRINAGFEVDPESGCWLWTRQRNVYGYGQIDVREDWQKRKARLFEEDVV